jgi:GNAT superfamily N-acetyltransferase
VREARVEVKPEAELTADDWQRIRRLVDSADWSRGGPPGPVYRYGAMPWRVLVSIDDALVAHAGVGDRTVAVGGRTVRTGTVGGVSTLPAWEGRGLATLALDAALAFVRDALGAPFGLLTCRDHMVPFYIRRGWQMLTVAVTFEQPPDGPVRLARPYEAMVYPLGTEAWPAGDVDLSGLLV